MKRLAFLHYAGPPTVGGVELTLAHHARELAKNGYAIRIIAGSGGPTPHAETHLDPLFSATHLEVLQLKRSLDSGHVPDGYPDMVARCRAALIAAFAGCDAVVAHNLPTFNKHLALSHALYELCAGGHIRLIAWVHDIAWTNEQYLPELHDKWPYTLLREVWPKTRYVTVSDPRQAELAALIGLPPEAIRVIPPGIDPAGFGRWTALAVTLAERLSLLESDGVLLLPARITRRKNIELAVRVLAELRAQSGADYRLVVTGPPGPHNPANPGYLGELLALREQLGLTQSVHFLYAEGEADQTLIPDDDTVASLYNLADALFFPSLQEGFGIPILEAGLARLPIFCADIPPLRATGAPYVHFFDPQQADPALIAAHVLAVLNADSAFRLRRRTLRHYRWAALVRERLIPLLQEVLR